MTGVIVAQLLRLQHTDNPNKRFGYYVLGIPLSVICIGGSILVLVLSAYRFWRQQNAMLRGKVHAGGWEMNAIGIVFVLVRIDSQKHGEWKLTARKVTLLVFVLLIAVDVEKTE